MSEQEKSDQQKDQSAEAPESQASANDLSEKDLDQVTGGLLRRLTVDSVVGVPLVDIAKK